MKLPRHAGLASRAFTVFTILMMTLSGGLAQPAPDGLQGYGLPTADMDEPSLLASRLGASITGIPSRAPVPYPFFPQAGALWKDLNVINFVDLGDGVTPKSYDCAATSYAGHTGHDSIIGGFAEQAIGVPVFAALDGTVTRVVDGFPDMETTPDATRSNNEVVLSHGNGQLSRYVHFKTNSIAVAVGQVVSAGAQLGLTGSSGNSTWPHLHFESLLDNIVYEPSSGPCRAGASYWIRQSDLPASPAVTAFAFSAASFAGNNNYPRDEAVRTGTFVSGSRTTYFRVRFTSLPAGSTYRVRYLRPDGSSAHDSSGPFNNATLFRSPFYWFQYTINLNVTGTWRTLVDVNGVTVADAPFTVVASAAEVVNRAPLAVTVSFDPIAPAAGAVPFCRVSTSLVRPDPDYELVRYRYRWFVNGTIIRDVTSAALSDAIPKTAVVNGSTLACSVTPSDGTLSAAAVQVSAVVGAGSLNVDRPTLSFGAITSSGSWSAVTPPQPVRLTQNATGPVSWTATTSQPWLTVSPASGTGPALLTVNVTNAAGVPASGTLTASVDFTLNGSTAPFGPVVVSLRLLAPGASAVPIGSVDTPLAGATGVIGSIPVTGWALDDVGIANVKVWRDPVSGEAAGVRVFIGDAVLVEGARPDVAAALPAYPDNTRAGWGYLMLTNMLPAQGNGVFTLHMIATDREGLQTLLGSRTILCTNSQAIAPFGAIDTPAQGQTVSGSVNNFGWVLAPGATRADVPGGGTVNVIVDGVAVGSPTLWTSRSDLTALFPTGYSQLSSALAVHTLDTLTLSNGVHTIAWFVSATNGQAVGIGSRYFTVANGAGLSAAPIRSAMALADALVNDSSSISGRRGFNLDAPYRTFRSMADGRFVIQGEETDRIELRLGAGVVSGHLRAAGGLQPLPTGSRLDEVTGTFTWQPGVGYVGAYDFVFVHDAGTRRDVRVVLNPKSSNRVGPQVVIDRPARDGLVGRHFTIAGWAIDLDDEMTAGIDAVHVWAYPVGGSAKPMFLGAAATGGRRADVAALFGDRFERSGYGLPVDALGPGSYDLAVFAWSTVQGGFVPARIVRITVLPQ